MEFVTDYRTEKYVLNTTWEQYPEAVKEHALMCSLDIMVALILGSYGKQFDAGLKLSLMMGLDGDIPVVGDSHTFNLLGAAIAMGHSSNSFDIDDGHRQIQGHPGTSFIAGVLAAAMKQDVSYKEYLSTLVICYEFTIRWALSMQKEYGFLHSTGTYGAFGTALGIGRLLGFDEKMLNNALSIADYHAPLTPVMRAVEFPSMNKDGVPFGALVGTMAILETICGSTGRTHLLEKPEYKEHLDDFGEKWHILDLYFKPYTCCRWAHQPILACIDLMNKHGFNHTQVEQVKIYTFNSAAKLSKIKPSTTDEAQYNIAWPVASALVYGDVGYSEVRDEALDDNIVLSMMGRLDFIVDRDLDALFPGKRMAYVEIQLKDGTTYKSRVFEAAGEMDDPELNLEWIKKKFRRVTRLMLDRDKQEEIISMMINPELDKSIKELVLEINRSIKN